MFFQTELNILYWVSIIEMISFHRAPMEHFSYADDFLLLGYDMKSDSKLNEMVKKISRVVY